MTGPFHAPTWRIDGMTFPGYHTVDARGREWTILRDGETGWQGSAKPRTVRANRPFGDGAFRSRSYRDPRVLTLKGRVWCPDEDSREDTELELAGLCADGGRLYEYRRTTARHDMVALVELDDEIMVANPSGTLRLDFSFQFVAPDPRKLSFEWQEPVSYPPEGTTAQAGGLDYSQDVDYSGAGVEWGTGSPVEASVAQVGNHGTATAYPAFRVTGPATRPVIAHLETGRALAYGSDLVAGEVLTINADAVAQRGMPGHTVISSVRGNVGSLLTRSIDWPELAPQAVGRFQLLASGSPSAELKVFLRSAWH